MQLKSIIQGRLNFGSAKSFEQTFRMYEYRVENYYKQDLLFKEEVFDEENFAMVIPRVIVQGPEKPWINTVKLIEYLAQFALSGSVGAWLVHEGKILKYAFVEPSNEKVVVKNFLKGQRLAGVAGKEEEALKALTTAINKHDEHAQAYERRGFVNFQLDNMAGALYDFNKCISYDPSIPSSYYWRAKVHIRNEDLESAISDLDMTTKKAIALQPIYWKARRLKARCHKERGENDLAIRELRLFTIRKYETDNPNFIQVPEALYEYAILLQAEDRTQEALEAVDKALHHPASEHIPSDKLHTLRGKLKQDLGEDAHTDWQKAADLGSSEAAKLLEEFPA